MVDSESATITEGACDAGIEHGVLLAQMVRTMDRGGEEYSVADRLRVRSLGAGPRNSRVLSPKRALRSSTRRKSDSSSPGFSMEWRSRRPGLPRKAPLCVGGRTRVKGFVSSSWMMRNGPELLR